MALPFMFQFILKMEKVSPKKHLGQHFLIDQNAAKRIADSMPPCERLLELGPGTGLLTRHLLERPEPLWVIEIDKESVAYLQRHYSKLEGKIVDGDFLRMNLAEVLSPPFGFIGNFPYNISSQIFFKVLDHVAHIPVVVGMVQKEVGKRICAGPGSKENGILSILLQTWYDCEYLFTVKPGAFNPPPKVDSGVIRLTRNTRVELPCDDKWYRNVVKTAFGQRRKTLRNSLKSLILPSDMQPGPVWDLRAEQLNVEAFIDLAARHYKPKKKQDQN